MSYFLNIQGRVIGPMSASQVIAYNVNPNTLVSTDGTNWQPLYSFPELMQMINAPRANQTDSNRILCGIMAILFGWLGVQYFIMGKVGAGFLTILLTAVTCGAWEIITFIQGIMMLCMTDAEFERKYTNNNSTLPLF
ncbi:MAG: GYF domain-containing protein [Muribaculaceae bacterium]|nr:GYF domain-containing protein [Muribaculaceae bacterium]